MLSHLLLRSLALRLLLVLVLKLHRLKLARVPVAGQLIVRDGQRPKVSGVRLSRDEGVRRRLQHAINSSERGGVRRATMSAKQTILPNSCSGTRGGAMIWRPRLLKKRGI